MQRVHIDDLTGFLSANPTNGTSSACQPSLISTRSFRFRLTFPSPQIGRGAVARARAALRFGRFKTPNRQRRVLGSISTIAGAAWRGDGETSLGRALQGTAARIGPLDHAAKLGHGQQGRPRERLVGLHDLDFGAPETVVSHRRVAAARRLPRSENSVQSLAKKWGARRVLVEDAGAGTSLVQELKRRVSGIIAVRADGDKASRMAVASAKFEAGQVLLPERASWLADLEAELFVFPGSRHDDQCNSISQALLDKTNSFMAWLSPEDWERIIAKARTPVRRRVQL